MGTVCYRCMRGTIEHGKCNVCGARPVVRDPQGEDGDLLPLGSTLNDGNIVVGDKLGRGGFGITYLAWDKKYGLIALKEFFPRHMVAKHRSANALCVLPDKQEVYDKSLGSFLREAKLINELRHPNVVKVLFCDEENNTAYYGMQLLEGEDLAHWQSGRGPVEPRDALMMLAPVMNALAFIHERGVLHRDISPDNIFMCTDPSQPMGVSACLIDFGAAYTAMEDFTQTCPQVKKRGYSPLEQNWKVSLQGPFTDVYALCATLYFMLTREIPTPASDRMLGNDPLKPACDVNPNLSQELSDVLKHGLALEPKNRIQDISQLREQLNRCISGSECSRFEESGGFVDSTPSDEKPVPPEPGPLRSSASLFLDWLILCVTPFLPLCLFSPWLGFCVGIVLMITVNTILCSLSTRATLGQQLMREHLESIGADSTFVPRAFAYNVLRAIVPIMVLDETVRLCHRSDMCLTRKLTGFRECNNLSIGKPLSVQEPSLAELICIEGLMLYTCIRLGETQTFGRDPGWASVVLPENDRTVSNRHCSIRMTERGWLVVDEHATNGTFVNRERLPEGECSKPLFSGDTIRIGNEVFRFTLKGRGAEE